MSRWATRNESALSNMNSNLLFALHRLYFITLVISNNRSDAVIYARKYFAPFADTNMKGMPIISVIYICVCVRVN